MVTFCRMRSEVKNLSCYVALTLCVISLQSAAAIELPQLVWEPIFLGVESTSATLTLPRPIRLHAMRIDLTAEGVSVCTNDGNGDTPEETNGLRTSSFLKAKGCQVAVNGATFWPVHSEEGLPQNIMGLVVSQRELVSPVDAEPARPALVFRQQGLVSLESPPIDLDGIQTAVGVYWVVLRKGTIVREGASFSPSWDSPHPRTAAGIADDGRTLLLLVVDGRQPGYSEGVTSDELGELLRSLGAVEGINFDGGGTSTMAIANPTGTAQLINRPINGGKPGKERIGASHLGIYARPLTGTK